jgi:hypothetical protein
LKFLVVKRHSEAKISAAFVSLKLPSATGSFVYVINFNSGGNENIFSKNCSMFPYGKQ